MTGTVIPASLRKQVAPHPHLDYPLILAALVLLAVGLVMVTSASMTQAYQEIGRPHFYLLRQSIFVALGLVIMVPVLKIPVGVWEQIRFMFLVVALSLLVLVLVPGVGREVNGSTRWIPFGFFNLQVSEPAKLLLILYMAGYLARRGEEVQKKISGFIKPMLVMALVCVLLLLEPDLGAAAVIIFTAVVMMFLAGMRWSQFFVLVFLLIGALALLSVSASYRVKRLTSFMDPWADPFDTGFQLTNSLIAFGRGEWFGVGLGSGIQKLDYLPEAHTDFVFAVLGEELGLIGVLLIMTVYAFIVLRSYSIAAAADRAGKPFAAFAAYGIGTWLALQSFVNMGVVMGVLPTKGLTLPLMSYGGSSLVTCCAAIAVLLRIDFENRADGVLLTRSVWNAVRGWRPRHG